LWGVVLGEVMALERKVFLVRGVDLVLLRDLDRALRCEFAMLSLSNLK
jgi:hypothetical protein